VGDRAASHLGSQHIELAAWRVWVEAVLDQPAGHLQASQRPPRADHAEVDVGAVAGDDVAKVLLVPEREDGDVEERVAPGRLGPVDDAGDLVTVDEDVVDLQVAVDEHRCPRPERSLGEPSTASSAAWAAAGAAVRALHDAPLPPWPGRSSDQIASHLDGECEWLLTNGVLPADLVTRNRQVAEAALRPWTPVFTHGDLQVAHVFVDGDEITGVIDWTEAGPGDALYDLAILTLGHQEHLGDVVAGYGTDVDLDVIRAWWSLRSLRAVRWLIEHGFDPSTPGCEVDVLRSQL
jgi:hypothetical protein